MYFVCRGENDQRNALYQEGSIGATETRKKDTNHIHEGRDGAEESLCEEENMSGQNQLR